MDFKKNYTILSIDTSCDETSVAVTCDDWVLSNVVSSQVDLHREYGGVVPALAKRIHKERINPCIKEALKRAQTDLKKIDAIAVTYGPGLAPALEVGIKKAKELAEKFGKSLIAVNHMEGHLLSFLAKNSKGKGTIEKPPFPLIGLLASGGHTQLVLIKDFGFYKLLGETLDDAAGEAFDKVAKILNLGYPGGPIISDFAKKGDPNRFKLPIPMKDSNDLNFSFSGVKTACLYLVEDLEKKGKKNYTFDFCASFERVLIESLVLKLDLAVRQYRPKMVILGGGVICNTNLRRTVRLKMKKRGIPVSLAYSKKLFTDNAAMIGVCAFYKAKRGELWENVDSLDRAPSLSF